MRYWNAHTASRLEKTLHGEVPNWPFAAMQIGDTVLIPPVLAPRARAVLLSLRYHTGKRFALLTMRTEPRGLAVTRIADEYRKPKTAPVSNR